MKGATAHKVVSLKSMLNAYLAPAKYRGRHFYFRLFILSM